MTILASDQCVRSPSRSGCLESASRRPGLLRTLAPTTKRSWTSLATMPLKSPSLRRLALSRDRAEAKLKEVAMTTQAPALPRQERYVKLKDGWLFYLQQGQGEPLLLLHAAGASSWIWRNVIDALAERFTVYA